jgi:hypothetical protein
MILNEPPALPVKVPRTETSFEPFGMYPVNVNPLSVESHFTTMSSTWMSLVTSIQMVGTSIAGSASAYLAIASLLGRLLS